MKEIAEAFADRVQVVFYDVWKDPAAGPKIRHPAYSDPGLRGPKGQRDLPPRRALSQGGDPRAPEEARRPLKPEEKWKAFSGTFQQLLQHSPWLAVVAVFFGGVTTALNPCVLAMVPLLMGVVAGNRATTTMRRSLVFSLFFVLGLALTFTTLGLISGLMGRMFGDVGRFWKYAVAGVCLLMGLHLLGRYQVELAHPGRDPGEKAGSYRCFPARASLRRRLDAVRRPNPGRAPGLCGRERERPLWRVPSLRLCLGPFGPRSRCRHVGRRGQGAPRIEGLAHGPRCRSEGRRRPYHRHRAIFSAGEMTTMRSWCQATRSMTVCRGFGRNPPASDQEREEKVHDTWKCEA